MENMDNKDNENKMQAILVGVMAGRGGTGYIGDNPRPESRYEDFDHEMQEMESLIDACNMEVVAVMDQHLEAPNPATYIGSGKLEELSEYVSNMRADCVVFSDNLTPAQQKNIQQRVDARVYDRTNLILEIFATRARTREARLQVESASLKYMLPRLVGMRSYLGRQGGGAGSLSNKGQGEKQIELDRRRIEKRITELKRELEAISHDREIQRKRREKNSIPQVCLVGYTNAGKSTIMNKMVELSGGAEEKKVLQKDMLFATLDTVVRHIGTGDKKDFLLSDTVGFLSNLPHTLIKAFRSTLQEISYANLLLIVIDESDEHCNEHIRVTQETLKELEAGDIPRLYVYNKCDLSGRHEVLPAISGDRIYISAQKGEGLPELLTMIKKKLYAKNRTLRLLVPYSEGRVANELNEKATILSEEYGEDGIHIVADCPEHIADRMRAYSEAL